MTAKRTKASRPGFVRMLAWATTASNTAHALIAMTNAAMAPVIPDVIAELTKALPMIFGEEAKLSSCMKDG